MPKKTNSMFDYLCFAFEVAASNLVRILEMVDVVVEQETLGGLISRVLILSIL